MPKPTTRIYVAFNAGWTGTPVWTEVTAYVRHDPGISIDHGRSDEMIEANPNHKNLVLRNDDGRFTPGNTASPYYPNVTKDRRIKIESTTSAGTSIRFLGYVDDWKPTWVATVGGINDCFVSASSRMARLGRGAELRSVLESETLLAEPTSYYMLNEPEGSTIASDTSGNNDDRLRSAGAGPAIVFGNGTGPGGDNQTAVQFAGGKYLVGQTGSGLISAFVLHVGDGDLVTGTGALNSTLSLRITGGNLLADMTATNSNTASLSAPISAGVTHHVALIGTGATAALWIDGVQVDTAALGGTVPITSVRVGESWAGTMSHLAFGIAAADVPTIAEAGLTGFAGETPADRLTRYASYIGMGPTDLDLDTGQVPDLAAIDITGRTALDAMRTVEDTEEGVIFDARDGTLTFHDRAHRYSAASAFTLSYAGQIANPIEPVLDDQQQRNDVTATSTNGQFTAQATDQASVDEHGWYRDSLNVASTNEDEPLMHASWLVNQYADPIVRISSVSVLLNNLPVALVTALLAATVGTRFTLLGLPANAPAPTMDLIVEGTTETINISEHRISFHTSPAVIFDVWTVEDPVLGAYDSNPLAF